jgi:histidine kinase
MQVLSLGARCRHAEALAVGLEVLSKLGYSFPKKARLFHVLISFLKTDRILRDKTDSDIMDLPIAADPDKVVAAQFFNVLFPYAMNADPLLSLLINLRHVRLTLKHGLSRMSCAAIGAHAMMLCNGLGRVDEGCRLAKLSVRLQEKFEAREWLARVNVAACAFTLPWNHSLKDMLQPLLSAHRAGIVSGDIEMASFAAVTRGNLGFHCGRNIQSMTAELFTMVDFMIQNKQDNILEIARPLLQVLINLSRPELCNNPLEGDVCDIQGEIDSIFGSKDKKEMTLSWLLYLKAVVAFLYGDYRTVIKSNRQIKTHDLPPFISANKLLMEGMSVLLLSKINSYSKPNLARRQARKCILQLQTLVRYCSTNYSHKVDLLEAELLAYDREYHQALQRFNKAAETAKKHGFLREEALAWERIYTLYPDNEKALETAIRVYEEWGCLSKVKQLEQKRDSQAELQRRLTLDSSEMKYS